MMISAEGYRLAVGEAHSEEQAAADSVAALVPVYGTLLLRVAHAALRSRVEAEDVVQETFVRVLKHSKRLPEIKDMRVWLVRITWNLALDRRRRIQPDQIDAAFVDALAAATVPADRAIEQSANLRLVMQQIERLPKSEREALLLSAVDDMSTEQIAAVMRKSASAVRALLFRARARLRERVGSDTKKRGNQ